MSQPAQIPSAGLSLIEEIIRSQPRFESMVSLSSFIPPLIILSIFAASLYMFWLSTRYFKNLALFTSSCFALAFVGLSMFQGCSNYSRNGVNDLSGDSHSFVPSSPVNLFYAVPQHEAEFHIPLPANAGSLVRSYRASLQTGAYFSYVGDATASVPTSCRVAQESLPVFDRSYRIQNSELVVNPADLTSGQSSCAIFEFASGLQVQVALYNGLAALATKIQAEGSQIVDSREFLTLAQRLTNESGLPGASVSSSGSGRYTLSSSAYDDIALTQVNSSTLALVQMASTFPVTSFDSVASPSTGQVQAFNCQMQTLTAPSMALIADGMTAAMGCASDSGGSLDSTLGGTKWEFYFGRPDYYALAQRLLFWAASDVGGLENFDTKLPNIPVLSKHPNDLLSVYFAKSMPFLSSDSRKIETYGQGYLLNSANIGDPTYSLAVYERDMRSQGDVAKKVLDFHAIGLKNRLVSKGVIIDGPMVTQNIQRRQSANPQGSLDIQMPSGSTGSVTTINTYRGLFSYPSVELAMQAKQSFMTQFKAVFSETPTEAQVIAKMTTYLDGLNRGCGRDSADYLYTEARHSLSPACRANYYDPYNPDLLGCSEGRMEAYFHQVQCERPSWYPVKNAFPWMKGKDFMYVDVQPDGSAVLMVNVKSELSVPGGQAEATFPYQWFITLSMFNRPEKFFDPASANYGTTLIADFPKVIDLSQTTDFLSYFEEVRRRIVEFHWHQEPGLAVYKKAAADLTEANLNRQNSRNVLGGLNRVDLPWPTGLSDPNQISTVDNIDNQWGLAVYRRNLLECSWSSLVQNSSNYLGTPDNIKIHDGIWSPYPYTDMGLRCWTPPRHVSSEAGYWPSEWISYPPEWDGGVAAFYDCTEQGALEKENFPNLSVKSMPAHPSDLICHGETGRNFELNEYWSNLSRVRQRYACTCVESVWPGNPARTGPCEMKIDISSSENLMQNKYSARWQRREAGSACYTGGGGGDVPCCGTPGIPEGMPCRSDCNYTTCDVSDEGGSRHLVCYPDYCQAPWMEEGGGVHGFHPYHECDPMAMGGDNACSCVGRGCCSQTYSGGNYPIYQDLVAFCCDAGVNGCSGGYSCFDAQCSGGCADYMWCRTANAIHISSYQIPVSASQDIREIGTSRVEVWGKGAGGASLGCGNSCQKAYPSEFYPFDENWQYFLKRQPNWDREFRTLDLEKFKFSSPTQVWNVRRARLDASTSGDVQQWINQQTTRRFLDLMINYLEQRRTNPPLPGDDPLASVATPVLRAPYAINSNGFVQYEMDMIERERRNQSDYRLGREFTMYPGQYFWGSLRKEDWRSFYYWLAPGNVDTYDVVSSAWTPKVGARAERDLPILDTPDYWGGQKSRPPRRNTLDGKKSEIFTFVSGRPQRQRSFIALGGGFYPRRDQYWREAKEVTTGTTTRYTDPLEDVLPLWFQIESGLADIYLETDPLMIDEYLLAMGAACLWDLYAMAWEHQPSKTGQFENRLVYQIRGYGVKGLGSGEGVTTATASRNNMSGNGQAYHENLLKQENYKTKLRRPSGFGLLTGSRSNLEKAEIEIKSMRADAWQAYLDGDPYAYFYTPIHPEGYFWNPSYYMLSSQPQGFQCTLAQMNDPNYPCGEPARWESRAEMDWLANYRIDWPMPGFPSYLNQNTTHDWVYVVGEFSKYPVGDSGCFWWGENYNGDYGATLPYFSGGGTKPKHGFPNAYCTYGCFVETHCQGGAEYTVGDCSGGGECCENPACFVCPDQAQCYGGGGGGGGDGT